MDSLRPPDHLARTPPLHRAQTQVRRLPLGESLPSRGQDLEHGGDAQEREGVMAAALELSGHSVSCSRSGGKVTLPVILPLLSRMIAATIVECLTWFNPSASSCRISSPPNCGS